MVGIGKIARDQHVPAIARSGRFEIVATASRNGRIDHVPAYETLADMLASTPSLEAIVMCQPPQVRFDAAREALAAGKHVFLEKPPGATLSEVELLHDLARQQGVTLFAGWHSRYAPAVEPAHAWLAGRRVRAVTIDWKEDVRVWHPGQAWIWAPGGFGVFDPGINALSIATRILPLPMLVESASLFFPSNRAAPIAATIALRDLGGAPIAVTLDWRQIGPQSWDIRVDTDAGEMLLSHGGAKLSIAGIDQPLMAEAEYPGLYNRFSQLIAMRACDVDNTPLRLVADAFLRGKHHETDPFDD